MKKLLLLGVIILAGFGAYTLYQKFAPQTVDNSGPAPAESKPNPMGATFIIEGDSVTLSEDGEAEIIGEATYGDINGDKDEDAVILIAESGGGSGVFIYVAGYVSGPVGYKGTNGVFIGDRISPQSVSIKSGVVTVKYLDRKDDEPFAAEPTVPTFKQFIFQNNQLVEK